jgi:hypothetical protein
MPTAFIIMQIGNTDLDQVCAKAIVPAAAACGLDPKRVDKHNQGGLLKSEIIKYIESSDILIADLTNERPNVYLEIGYSMGVDKFRNLILTVREDHLPDSPNRKPGDPKVHFDLAGYDILPWHPDKVDSFREELEKRIRRRLAVIRPSESARVSLWDEAWIEMQRRTATAGLASLGRSGFMEVRTAVYPPKLMRNQAELSDAARASMIRTFGWPIAVYLDGDDGRPRPRADGIVAEIALGPKKSYDYWAIRRNADFYFLGSLFEDERRPGEVFFNTRIVRVTETLLYLIRLYSKLGLDRSGKIAVVIRHGGLKGRVLTAVGERHVYPQKTDEDQIDTGLDATLDELEASLVPFVSRLLAPLFLVFDFTQFEPAVYEDIVGRFVKGEVS